MATSAKNRLTQAKDEIRERIAKEEAARLKLLKQNRLRVLGSGVQAYQAKHMTDAALAFKNYILTLERTRGVPRGGLAPSHFDRAKEVTELLLVSGTYWDLTKLYDRTRSAEAQAEFKEYLGKFILFTKGMPFQGMSAETMRKYIQSRQAVHRSDFVRAYKAVQTSKCFVATTLVEYVGVDTIPRLREFRDCSLKQFKSGRKFVAWYYRNGPQIATRVEKLPSWLKLGAGSALDLTARVASLCAPRWL